MTKPETTARTTSPGLAWAGLTAGLSVILVALLMLFILPALRSGPRDLAVGIVGQSAEVTAVDDALQAKARGAYALQEFDTQAQLDEAILEREIVGGFSMTGDSVRVSVASAGSTAVSGTITATGAAIAESLGMDAVVDDIVPLPATDPTGVGIGGLAFPLVFGGIVPAVAFRSVMKGHRTWILAGLVGFSVIGGLVVATVLRFAFGSISDSFLPVAAAVGLGIAALALPLAGLQECFGSRGFTIAAMSMMFIGNPFAGIATGSLWLPSVAATIGQLLPPGAAGTLVRSAAYFGGTGGSVAAVTLAGWVAAGLLLWFLAPRLRWTIADASLAAASSSVVPARAGASS